MLKHMFIKYIKNTMHPTSLTDELDIQSLQNNIYLPITNSKSKKKPAKYCQILKYVTRPIEKALF